MKILKKYNKLIQYILFLAFFVFNTFLMVKHEPWRDEIHAWTMAKYLSLKDLFVVSKFDGHPILWHLILMPFAKLNFPIITLQIISLLIVDISAYLFVFHTKIDTFQKFLILFTVPFLYIYSSISRNYCLILLILIIIGIFYKKRYDYPIIYSLLICLLIHTHSLSWGIVAGLTLSFHFYEIINHIKYKNVMKIKEICIGLLLIILNTLLVIFELFGTTNPDYILVIYPLTKKLLAIIAISFIVFSIFTIKFSKTNQKELFIIFCGFAFQCIIYLFVYGAITENRYFLPCVLWLFYIILLSNTNILPKTMFIFSTLYLAFNFFSGYVYTCYDYISKDNNTAYSGAIEMANYINENLSDEKKILVSSSIHSQTMIPYLKNAHLYDIYYKDYFENIKYMSNTKKDDVNVFDNLDEYSQNYIIVPSYISLDYTLIYQTSPAITDENYSLYFIN